ncbi:MAG: zf-TFIIB domain-containing protein [Oligoflexia bacterium]|nr:zf-TFIIB domain-containing protein [Oligoflexia bacterium]
MSYISKKMEDAYFLTLEMEQRQKARAQKNDPENRSNMEKNDEKPLCPHCKKKLSEAVYQTIKIESCVDCKGAWVKFNVLEKLLDGNQQNKEKGLFVFLDRQSKIVQGT